MQKVLVTGGAGYIGSVLVRQLLDHGFFVRVMDNLSFGGESILELMNNPHFEFYKGDVRVESDVRKALPGVSAVAHLASIVGDPACAAEPDKAKSTNYDGSVMLYRIANELGVKKFIFASTCSNYGKMKESDGFLDESSALNPVSLYAETKVSVEKYLTSQDKQNVCKPTCLRFSTVYGLSPRPRFDLTVNEFARDLALGRELTIFGEQFWRPYCHVVDLARSVVEVIKADEKLVAFEVFNVGDTGENYQKKMLVNEIAKHLKEVKVKYVHKVEDPRDYRVSFAKIQNKLNFHVSKKVPSSVADIIKVVQEGFLKNPDDPKYSNVGK